MLPPALKHLKASLTAKGILKRSLFEDAILDELNEVDNTLNRAKGVKTDLTEGVEKKGGYGPSVLGPAPGNCTICGRII